MYNNTNCTHNKYNYSSRYWYNFNFAKSLEMLGLMMFLLRIENDEARRARQAARNAIQLRKQQIRDTSNPFTLPEEMFRMHYR